MRKSKLCIKAIGRSHKGRRHPKVHLHWPLADECLLAQLLKEPLVIHELDEVGSGE